MDDRRRVQRRALAALRVASVHVSRSPLLLHRAPANGACYPDGRPRRAVVVRELGPILALRVLPLSLADPRDPPVIQLEPRLLQRL